jgi:hypothetical protein
MRERTGSFGYADESKPVASLDRLYSQALGLAGPLRDEVAALAARSGGALDDLWELDPVGVPAGMPAALVQSVRRRMVKCPRRAMEKALWCYDGDVSRLADVCRCRVMFEGLEGICEFLEGLRGWQAFIVLRVKDYVSEDHDPRISCGFRVSLI